MKPTTPTTPADANHPHYAWGASVAKQWRTCPGSVNFARANKAAGKIPADTSTSYSKEGTTAHDWAEKCLRGEIALAEIPPEFRIHLEGYIELANELRAAAPPKHYAFIEAMVPLFYNKNEKGTVDFAVVSDEGVDLLDLKYGAGVPVSADENDQMIIYAVSLLEALELEGHIIAETTPVRLHIWQPRWHAFDGLPSTWRSTVRELYDFAIDIKADYLKSREAGEEDLSPSPDACQFCDARRICTVRITNLFEDIPVTLNPLVGNPDPDQARAMMSTMDDRTRLAVFMKGKAIAKFFEELNESTLELIESGVRIEGMKSVDGGPGNRTWGDEVAAEKLLSKIPIALRFKPRQVISPAQVEKVLKMEGVPFEKQSTRFKNRFNELISRKEGGPKLALASDKKPARVPVLQQFDDETEDVVDESDCF